MGISGSCGFIVLFFAALSIYAFDVEIFWRNVAIYLGTRITRAIGEVICDANITNGANLFAGLKLDSDGGEWKYKRFSPAG